MSFFRRASRNYGHRECLYFRDTNRPANNDLEHLQTISLSRFSISGASIGGVNYIRVKWHNKFICIPLLYNSAIVTVIIALVVSSCYSDRFEFKTSSRDHRENSRFSLFLLSSPSFFFSFLSRKSAADKKFNLNLIRFSRCFPFNYIFRPSVADPVSYN